MSTDNNYTEAFPKNGYVGGWPTPPFIPIYPYNPDPYHTPYTPYPYYIQYTPYPQQGCICPGDATPYCKNPMCPRKNPFDKLTTT